MFSGLAGWVDSLFTPAAAPSGQDAELADILKVPAGELGAIRMGRRYHYRPFSISKRDGRERRILAPSPALKQLQRRLVHNYLETLPIHPAATAFFPGASIVNHTQRHAGQAVIATVDLQDFFESTSAERVRDFFLRQGWRGEALAVLMRLCVYRNGLPQGAPTSPCLSNLVNVELDRQLAELARRANARYTRYGDDLAFSWSVDEVPSYFESAVRRILLNARYQPQPCKDWRIYGAAQEPCVTGLKLGRDGWVRAPERLHRKIWWLRLKAWWTRDPAALAQLQGYEGFLQTPGLRKH